MAQADASENGKPPARRRRWRSWLIPTLVVMVLLGGVAVWWFAGNRVWTDERDIRVAERDARLREVLWNKPAAVEGPINAQGHEYEPALSPDGAELYFVRGKPGEGADIFVSHRRANAWTKPEPVGAVNTPGDELGPRVSADGRFLLFYSDRPGGVGGYDVWAAERAGEVWGTPFNVGKEVNGPFNEYSPVLTPDGKRLIFASNRKAAWRVGSRETWRATIREAELGDYDLMFADVVPGGALSFSTAAELKGVNTPSHDGACDVSPGGDFIYFASNRPGGFGKFDLYRGRLRGDQVVNVENLGPPINTVGNEADPQLALAGFRLVFSSDREGSVAGGYDLFTADSREVFAARDARSLPAVGWSWWILLLSLLLLFPLIWMFRGLDDRKLTLLQRCALVSLLIHILLGLFFGAVGVTQTVIEFVRAQQGGAIEIAANLERGQEVAIGERIRRQVNDLEAPAAPTVEVAKSQPEAEPVEIPRPTPRSMEVPKARVEPSPMPVSPVAAPPPAKQDRIEPLALAQPQVSSVPEVKIEPKAAVVAPEVQPVAAAPQPEGIPPQSSGSPAARPLQVSVPSLPVTPNTNSLATAAAVSRGNPPLPVEVVKPHVQTAQAATPQVGGPQVRPLVGAATQPAPQIARADPSVGKQATATPAMRPANVDLAAPAVASVREASAVKPATPLATTSVPVTSPRVESVPLTTLPRGVAPDVAPPVVSAPPTIASADERLAAATLPPPRNIDPKPIEPARVVPPTSLFRGSGEHAPKVNPEIRPLTSPMARITPDLQAPSLPAVRSDRVAPAAPMAPLTGALGPVGPTAADALMRRAFEQRTPVIEDLGGTKESELAVARALQYLAKNQEDDGRWTKYMRNRTPGGRDRHDTAFTALPALCFLGADHTPAKDGPYQKAVTRALEYILSIQRPDGDLRNGGDMYDQGIGTIALAEAAQMTKDERYKRAALLAAQFIVRAQNPEHGGWRYQPRADGDTSVLGWQVMALHSAEALGYEVPRRTRTGALRWLGRVSSGRHEGLAGYTNSKPRKSMTAEALFSRILLGEDLAEDTISEASAYLIADSPTSAPIDHYTWYYTSLALMQLQNDAWTKWNGQLRDFLVKLQRRSGELEGSWDMDANYGQRAGRVYSTALSTLTLEVYYRYLPMYSKARRGE